MNKKFDCLKIELDDLHKQQKMLLALQECSPTSEAQLAKQVAQVNRGGPSTQMNDLDEQRDRIEYQMLQIRTQQEKNHMKKEQSTKKPTKIQNFKDDIDQVVFSNIQGLVDPNSNGAKLANQRI